MIIKVIIEKTKTEPKEAIQNDLNALLAEYSALKAEETECEKNQVTIATTLFTFISAILGINFFFAPSNKALENSSQFMILGFCLILVMFFGCLWMYQLYCHIRFGAYLYHLEEDINNFYREDKRKLFFEHWITIQEEGKFFLFKVSWLYGCMTFGTWIVAPILLLAFAKTLFPAWDVRSFYFDHGPFRVCFFLGISFIYYFLQFSYLIEILRLKSEKALGDSRT